MDGHWHAGTGSGAGGSFKFSQHNLMRPPETRPCAGWGWGHRRVRASLTSGASGWWDSRVQSRMGSDGGDIGHCDRLHRGGDISLDEEEGCFLGPKGSEQSQCCCGHMQARLLRRGRREDHCPGFKISQGNRARPGLKNKRQTKGSWCFLIVEPHVWGWRR